MRLFSDYHLHPQGHRLQPYTLELLQPWVDSARQKGLSDIAFTDHDRYCEGIDFDVLERLREANPDVKVRAGVEWDNDPGTGAAGRRWVEKNRDRLDFVLGSVHYLDSDRMFDSADQAVQFHGSDIDGMYRDYFRRVREMIGSGLVDCLSHLDLIKIHGFRPQSPIAELVRETLGYIKESDLAIELSTAGWRKPVEEQYPSAEVIQLAQGVGIPFTTASDAHSHVQMGEDYDRLAALMSELGVHEVCVFEAGERAALRLETSN